jgi:GTP-binding protein Era
LNKLDAVPSELFEVNEAAFRQGLPPALALPISASRGDNLPELLETILQHLPEGPAYFPEDQLTDLYEREIAADLIRESALILLRDEVPHGIAVRIDQYTERGEEGVYIEATLFVERESHKPIIIGKQGQMLKKIGSAARLEIEKMSGRKAYLQLKVKLRKNWRDDEKTLKNFGY